jgi:bile acid:Na+ symporter, BASS family
MTAAKIVILLLKGSIFLTVFSLGLQSTWQDATSLFRQPGLLFRSVLSMNIAMPIIAVVLGGIFGINPAVKAALILLAVSPVPPVLPRQQVKLGGIWSFVCGLLVAEALFAIVLVPLTVAVLGAIYSRDVSIGPGPVAKVVLQTILVPIALGLLVRARAPAFADRWAKPIGTAAFILLVLCVIPLLIVEGKTILTLIGNGTILVIAAFVAAGAAVGHWLGGPNPANRTTLALGTASRHPGLAATVAMANFPGQIRSIAAAIILYFIVKAIVLMPYTSRRKRLGTAPGEPGLPGSKPRAA